MRAKSPSERAPSGGGGQSRAPSGGGGQSRAPSGEGSRGRFGAWPAVIGAVVLGGLGVFVALRPSGRSAASPQTGSSAGIAAAAAEALTPPRESATGRAPVPSPAVATAPIASAGDGTQAAKDPPPVGPAGDGTPATEDPPPVGPARPPLTLDEKLELTGRHVGVLDRRATSLEAEIAAAEREGDGDLAEKKRVQLVRLRAHIASLRADVAAGREPDKQ